MNSTPRNHSTLLLVLLGFCLWQSGAMQGCTIDGPKPIDRVVDAVELVVIVYESSTTPIPLHVHEARRRLESSGYEVRVIDPDVETGTGTTPAEIKPAIEAAKVNGLPALVLLGKSSAVVRVMDLPNTADAIVESIP